MKLARLSILLIAASYSCFSMVVYNSERIPRSRPRDSVHNVKADIETWRNYLGTARQIDPLGRVNYVDASNYSRYWRSLYGKAIADLNTIAGQAEQHRRKACKIRSETARDALLFAAQCPILSRKQVSNIYNNSGFMQKRHTRWPQEERQKARLYVIAALRAELREWVTDELTQQSQQRTNTTQDDIQANIQSLSYSQLVDSLLEQYAHPQVALQHFPHVPYRYVTKDGNNDPHPQYIATPQELMSKTKIEHNPEMTHRFHKRIERTPHINDILYSPLY